MFARFRKDYWTSVGGVQGYHAAVEKLGPRYHEMNTKKQKYNDPNCVWGYLANLTKIPVQNVQKTRKWLYTVWKKDRRQVRSLFEAQRALVSIQGASNEPSNIVFNNDTTRIEKESSETSMSAKSVVNQKPGESLSPRRKKVKIPLRVAHFVITKEEWLAFFDYEQWNLAADWTNKLVLYLKRVDIDCTTIVIKHKVRPKNSRKRNCNFLTIKACCKRKNCSVKIVIMMEQEPKNRDGPGIFTVNILGNPNHNPVVETAGRPVTGAVRAEMAEHVAKLGPLGSYERNIRLADQHLLQVGNLTEVPPLEVLRKIKHEYDKKFRFDEDMFKDIRMFREFTYKHQKPYKEVAGFLQTCSEWPFTVHFFTEIQLRRFADYCKSEKYSYLHIDATGSVVRTFKDQNAVYFYTMVFQTEEKSSSILPLSGALLCDQSATSITSYFNCVRSKLESCKKNVHPSFVIIDFSPALLNSALASFNVENIHNHLRRCNNTLNRAYNTKQLRHMTFVRLCVNHVMKAFARSINKIEKSKEARRQLMSLFAILLNCTDVKGAFDLYEQIMSIYADPYIQHSARKLSLLLDTTDLSEYDIETFLKEDQMDDGEPPHFLDEIDITNDPIIHQSPFNMEARARIHVLNRLILKIRLDEKPSNPLYSSKIVHLFHKWFAYLPLWSCIMTEFLDRYANDGKNVSTLDWKFGHGRVSNAIAESYFSIVKNSILRRKTHLRPKDFLSEMYYHISSRFTADQFGIAQSSRGRKNKQKESDDINAEEVWRGIDRSNSTGSRQGRYFGDKVGQSKACKLSKGKEWRKDQLDETTSDTSATHSPASTRSKSRYSSSDDSFGFLTSPSNPTTGDNGSFVIAKSSSSTSIQLPTANQRSDETVASTFDTAVILTETNKINIDQSVRRGSRLRRPNSKYFDEHISSVVTHDSSRVLSPKRSHSPSTFAAHSTAKPQIFVQRRKQVKCSPPNSPNKPQSTPRTRDNHVLVGTLKLTWPRYGIKSGIYEGNIYSVTKTCPLDTGLFTMYHAYKAGTTQFRGLFENDDLPAYESIRQTFQLVDSDGWITARLHWLLRHNLLSGKDQDGVFNIEDTLSNIVFQFVKPMQEYQINSECSCVVCPKRTRQRTSFDISLSRINQKYVDYIPSFNADSIGYCGANLGQTEPIDYPADTYLDDKFPVVDLETKVTTTGQRYICYAKCTTRKQHFTYVPPFLVVNVGTNQSLMTELSNSLYIDQQEYRLSAGYTNRGCHFVAIIKTNDGSYVHFNDIHPRGCFPHDGMQYVHLALYVLHV